MLGHGHDRQKVVVVAYYDLWLSRSCLVDGEPDCQAYQATLRPEPFESEPSPSGWLRGNPASLYCTQIGGRSAIARWPRNGEVSLCFFPDGSAIMAWSLLNDAQGKLLLPRSTAPVRGAAGADAFGP